MTLNSAGPGRGAIRGAMSPAPGHVAAVRAMQAPIFIIGNKAFFLAVKRALDIGGGFHIVGAFRMHDLNTSLRRSTMLGQRPMAAVIHEAPGERHLAEEAARAVLEVYPSCGIVLVSGDELEAAAQRRIGSHSFNAIVASESAIRSPKTMTAAIHSAMEAAGTKAHLAA